jgi:hypothetical protein
VPNLRVTTEFPVAATGRAYNSEPIGWLAGLNVKLLEIYLRRLEPPDLCGDNRRSYLLTAHLVEPSRLTSHTKFRGPSRVRIRTNIEPTFFPCSTNARQSCTNKSTISAETAPIAITRYMTVPSRLTELDQ